MASLRRRALVAAAGVIAFGGSIAAAAPASAHTGACVSINGGAPIGVFCHAPNPGGHASCLSPEVNNSYVVVCVL